MSELTTLFTNIANAIRSKTGDTSAIPATNFSSAINSIPSAQIKEITTSGGSTSITVPGISGKSFMFTATAQKEGNGMLLYGYSSNDGFTYFFDWCGIFILPSAIKDRNYSGRYPDLQWRSILK